MSNTPTEQKLEKACQDILYGILAFDYAYKQLQSMHVNNTDKKFFLDSFIIHFRALYYFFYIGIDDKKRHDDDNVAEYYLPNYQDFINNRINIKLFASYKTKANKQLAHLSFKRRDAYYQLTKLGGWPVKDIKSKLDITIGAFFECLPELKKPWFKNAEKLIEDLPIPPNIKKLYSR